MRVCVFKQSYWPLSCEPSSCIIHILSPRNADVCYVQRSNSMEHIFLYGNWESNLSSPLKQNKQKRKQKQTHTHTQKEEKKKKEKKKGLYTPLNFSYGKSSFFVTWKSSKKCSSILSQ